MYLLGFDIGSSSVKAALVEAATGQIIGAAHYPEREMDILAAQPDWAEQHPATWWAAVCHATHMLLDKTQVAPSQIAAIGIAYQMHGLVALDAQGEVLRPSIIWCDSRAVTIGEKAFQVIGEQYCLEHYLNTPGNFTASKLRWIRENEPDIFKKIDKIMLPGDYIAYRMTGEICSTVTGLSEGVFWDFTTNGPAKKLLDYYEIPETMLPPVLGVFEQQGRLHTAAAAALGLPTGIPVGCRAGGQPNNALSLNVLHPG
ncbi:MAG: carbohydrate kinase, partial [Saprospiraceae bacterium]|nr:carbohydrate kinase [Saprospiraceae bacterium]